jgi:hypothetical protein
MTKFVDSYAKADPVQRAAMLKGADSLTFKAIDTVLGQTARYNPTGEVAQPYNGPTSGTISAYDPTKVQSVFDAIKTGSKVANTALDLAVYDGAGVITRSAQLLRDSLGMDTETADKIQQFWSDSKNKSLKSLATDDQRVVAGGIASGLESVASFAAAGPVGALITLGSIAANNAYQDGATNWMDKSGKAYSTKEDAIRAAGASNIRQLTPEENMKRTAVMTAIEIAGEAAGIPGMSRLMKGIPLTGSTGEIVNAVKNFGIGFANEQASELLTTTAQMAADKWTSFGLSKDATVDDYVKALRDTALATTAAVGTAGSISTATRNMRDMKNYFNPFSTNTGLDTVSPTVPSLKEAAKQLGISESEYSTIQTSIQNSVRSGNYFVDPAKDVISSSLQAKGMSAVKADAVADGMASKITDMTVSDFLTSSGVDPTKVAPLTSLISSQINPNIDTNVAAKNIASIFASSGMDPATASKAASRFYSYTVTAPTITQADMDLSNQVLMNAGVDLGSAYKPATGTPTVVTPSGATVTEDQLKATFGTTGGTTTAAPLTPDQTAYSTTGTLTGAPTVAGPTGYSAADVRTTIANAIANVNLPQNISKADVATQISQYLTANPGLNASDVANAVVSHVQKNPQLTELDVGSVIAASPYGTTAGAAIENILRSFPLPESVNRAEVSNVIRNALAANPSLTAQDVANKISSYAQIYPTASMSDLTAVATAAPRTAPTETMSPLDTRIAELVKQGLTNEAATAQATKEAQGQTTQTQPTQTALQTRITELTKQGFTVGQATDKATKEAQGVITAPPAGYEGRIAELVGQGLTSELATQTALDEMKVKQEADAKAARASTAQAGVAKNLASAAAMVAPAAAAGSGLVDRSTPGFADIGFKTTGEAKFEGPLDQYLKMVKADSYAGKPQQQETQQPQQVAPVQDELSPQTQPYPQQGSDYFNYGQQTDIDRLLPSSLGADLLGYKAGGLATPLFAGGGTTRHGRYAGGGLGVIEHSGKARLDFRSGNAVTGPGDGQSDDIPAMLADGEFVFPADVVAALGNGSTKAGSDKLYDMMHSIRAHHRSAKPKDLPPPAKKSPLDYLKKPARKVRR